MVSFRILAGPCGCCLLPGRSPAWCCRITSHYFLLPLVRHIFHLRGSELWRDVPQGGASDRNVKRKASAVDTTTTASSTEEKLQLLAECTGQLFARTRTVEAAIGRTYTVPKDTDAVTLAQNQLEAYAGLVKAEGKGHKQASPHGYGALGFLSAIAQATCLTPEETAALHKIAALCTDPIETGKHVTVFRLSKCFKEDQNKVRIAVSPTLGTSMLPQIIDKVVTTFYKGEIKSGDAPMNPRERKLREVFDLGVTKMEE